MTTNPSHRESGTVLNGTTQEPASTVALQENQEAIADIKWLERLFEACEANGESVLDWTPWDEAYDTPQAHLAYLKRLNGLNKSNGTY